MLCSIIIFALLFENCKAFLNPVIWSRYGSKNIYEVRSRSLFSSTEGNVVNSSESPLVDRALDSALDFLQDAEAAASEEESDEFDMFELYEDSPDIDIPYELISQLEEKEANALANAVPKAEALNKAVINEAVARWRKHDNDVGSAEVQVAIAHERVKYLTKHLLANKKDVAAKRGLQAVVVARRKFLDYLYESDPTKANEMISELGIRFRPPGRLWDKQDKYGAFKNIKAKYVKDESGKKRKVKK